MSTAESILDGILKEYGSVPMYGLIIKAMEEYGNQRFIEGKAEGRKEGISEAVESLRISNESFKQDYELYKLERELLSKLNT